MLIEAVASARQNLVDLIQRKEATVLTEGSLPRVVGDGGLRPVGPGRS